MKRQAVSDESLAAVSIDHIVARKTLYDAKMAIKHFLGRFDRETGETYCERISLAGPLSCYFALENGDITLEEFCDSCKELYQLHQARKDAQVKVTSTLSSMRRLVIRRIEWCEQNKKKEQPT